MHPSCKYSCSTSASKFCHLPSMTKSPFFSLNCSQFYQQGVQDKLQKLEIFNFAEIQGLTIDGKSVSIRSKLAKILSQDAFAKYLSVVYLVLTQLSDGEYVLKANVRGVGGGNFHPKEKKSKAAKVKPQAQKVEMTHEELFDRGNKFLEEEKFKEGAEVFLALASQDYPPAFFMLSQCYLGGLGVKQDIPQSVNFLGLAAENGHELAAKMLGWSFVTGHLVSEDLEVYPNLTVQTDYERGIKYLKMASGNEMLYQSTQSSVMVMTLSAMIPQLKFDPGLADRFLKEGWEQIHLAIVLGDFHLFTAFVMQDPMVVRKVDNEQHTLFHIASGWGRDVTAILESLFQIDANNLKKVDRLGHTALHFAAWGGNLETFDWLVGKDPTLLAMTSNDKFSVAHMAAKGGHLEVLKKIFAKAKPLLRAPNKNNQTPRDIAVQEGHNEIAAWLENPSI